jgi:hypothetical protein
MHARDCPCPSSGCCTALSRSTARTHCTGSLDSPDCFAGAAQPHSLVSTFSLGFCSAGTDARSGWAGIHGLTASALQALYRDADEDPGVVGRLAGSVGAGARRHPSKRCAFSGSRGRSRWRVRVSVSVMFRELGDGVHGESHLGVKLTQGPHTCSTRPVRPG